MLCVGLTGNIASGKTTVALAFASLGVPIINCDAIAKTLTTPKTEAFAAIINYFGTQARLPSGDLDRAYLRSRIFTNTEERLWLENLLHPLIHQEIINELKEINAPYCIIEIPLLASRADYPYINQILLITTRKALAVHRVMERDLCTVEQAEAIISIQPREAERLAIADEKIVNDSNLTELNAAVNRLHQRYLLLAMAFKKT